MAEIDVIDEAIIEADPATVYKAVIAEATGKTSWWQPHLESKPRGEIPPDRVGGMVAITVHRRGTPRFVARTVEVIENKLLRVEYIEGDFSGEGLWTFEPVDDQIHQTRLRFHWRVRPRPWLLRLLAQFVDIGKAHSEVVQAGFEGLNQYIRRKKETL